jgi:hypothetical protein
MSRSEHERMIVIERSRYVFESRVDHKNESYICYICLGLEACTASTMTFGPEPMVDFEIETLLSLGGNGVRKSASPGYSNAMGQSSWFFHSLSFSASLFRSIMMALFRRSYCSLESPPLVTFFDMSFTSIPANCSMKQQLV